MLLIFSVNLHSVFSKIKRGKKSIKIQTPFLKIYNPVQSICDKQHGQLKFDLM